MFHIIFISVYIILSFMLPPSILKDIKDIKQKLDVIYDDLDGIYNKYDVFGLNYVLSELSDVDILLTDIINEFEH